MKIALISDIHNGDLIECRPGKEALVLMSKFINYCESEGIDYVFELGDRVNNKDRDSDIKNLLATTDLFNKSSLKVFHAIGNHDIHYMDKKENLSILDMDSSYYSVELEDNQFIFMDSTDEIIGHCGGYISPKQLQWLDLTLAKATKPVIICSHHPLFEQNQDGNPFFRSLPGEYKVMNDIDVIKIIEKYKDKIVLLLNGHVHWNYVKRLHFGIPCFSVPSLLENYPLMENAPGNFSVLEIDGGKIYCSSHSLNPMRTIGMFELS